MTEDCSAIEAAVSVFGRAWAGAVLQALLAGAERFTDIRRACPGVTDAVLSTRLRELCARGFAERAVDPGPPVGVHYRPTALALDAAPVLAALRDFGKQHRDDLVQGAARP